ncbi:MAG TPA: hypothetical protein VGH14_21820 [Solirubrobacterales bacterium]|jgi:hypothetical protein
MSAEALSVDAAISGYRDAKVSRGQLIAALTLAGATAVGAAAFVSSIDSSHGTPTGPASTSSNVRSVNHNQTPAAAKSQVQMHEDHIGMQAGGR